MDFKPEFSWEFLSADEIHSKSIRALRNHIKHVKGHSPFYQNIFNDIQPDDITSIEDFQSIPFTDKNHIVDNYQQFRGISFENVVETVITSGTTGNSVPFLLTATDLDRLAFNEALSFHALGIKPGDCAQIMISLDHLILAGIAYYRGLILLGANTMRAGIQSNETQRHNLDKFRPSVIIGIPSYLKILAQELNNSNFAVNNYGVKKIVCTGESLKTSDMKFNSLANSLESLWGAEVFSSYTSTELSVSYCECEYRKGCHCHPELVYTEIIDENGLPVPDGTPGELVATPLGVEGMPLVRFRTGDITFKISEQCLCGRNSIRIGPILGRKSQIIKVRGTTIYPLSITDVLDSIDTLKDYIIIIENDSSLTDRVSIHVAASPTAVEQIANNVRAVTNVNFPILISNINTIQSFRRASNKKIRIVDWRKKK